MQSGNDEKFLGIREMMRNVNDSRSRPSSLLSMFLNFFNFFLFS